MSTPLKALLQERLRAKIVRQGDEDDGVAADGAASLGDASEYISPSPRGAPRARGYTTTTGASNRRSRTPSEPLTFGDELRHNARNYDYAYRSARDAARDEAYDGEDDYRRRRNDNVHGRRTASSPLRSHAGAKRQWHELPQDERSMGYDEASFRHKRPTRERRGVQPVQRQAPSPPPMPEMPRKNYDLSRAYQQYRELSSKRGNASRAPAFAPRDSERDEYDPISALWSSSELTRSARPFAFDDELYVPNAYHDESYRQPAERRTARWHSPTRRASLRSTTPVDHTLKVDLYETSGSHQFAGDRDGYPVEHISPTYRSAAISPRAGLAERRTASPCVSSRFYEPFTAHQDESENRIVFRTATRAMLAPRSPRSRQFLRHETTSDEAAASTHLDNSQSFDSKLSPDSHQAAKDFVEKRQKRSSQGTPRTMATHRWLQSMVDARREATDDETVTETRAQSPFSPSEAGDTAINDVYAHDDALVKPAAYHCYDSRRGSQEAALSPVYSPPRYTSTASAFFSSAV